MRQAYLQGVKDCERMYNAGYTFTELEDFVGLESRIGGCLGFRASIEHFEKVEASVLEECKKLSQVSVESVNNH